LSKTEKSILDVLLNGTDNGDPKRWPPEEIAVVMKMLKTPENPVEALSVELCKSNILAASRWTQAELDLIEKQIEANVAYLQLLAIYNASPEKYRWTKRTSD
jgi:hypothetical protein